MDQNKKVKYLAFYLPQFHTIPENDNWWGAGFTEWTNVRKANSLFSGHFQPKVPLDLGYYDLRNASVQIKQSEMARNHGIDGFCYWHYWFGNGKRLLELPSKQLLSNSEIEFPYCFAWANQTWTGVWHGAPDRILIKQNYFGEVDDRNHFYELLPHFKDSRYFKFRGRPVFIIYRPKDHPYLSDFIQCWQKLAAKEFLGEFYFLGISYDRQNANKNLNGIVYHESFLRLKPKLNLFDLACKKMLKKYPKEIFNEYKFGCQVISFDSMVRDTYNLPLDDNVFPTITTGWDNTPRSGPRGFVYSDFNLSLFEKHVKKVVNLISEKEESLCFVKSWNEWAEGNFLEPDSQFGYGKLKIFKESTS